MKKITKTLVLAAMIVPGVMQAQHGFKVGAKLGLNMANVVDSDVLGNKSKLGLHVGPTLHYGFGDEGRFAIGLDVLYSQKGSKKSDFMTADLKPYSLSYIDVPLYFRFRFGFGLYLETGVDVGLLMSAKYDGNSEREESSTTYNNDGDPVTVINKVKIKDETKGVDVGYLFGLGYIHRSGFGIGYRYNLGLTNLNKGSIFDEDYNGGIALNTVGQISAMYYFKWSDGGGRGKKKRGHRRR